MVYTWETKGREVLEKVEEEGRVQTLWSFLCHIVTDFFSRAMGNHAGVLNRVSGMIKFLFFWTLKLTDMREYIEVGRTGDSPGGALDRNLPVNMQRTWVRSLVWEDFTCQGATKPMHHNYWARALEPVSHSYWACVSTACIPQQEKPPQWEVHNDCS